MKRYFLLCYLSIKNNGNKQRWFRNSNKICFFKKRNPAKVFFVRLNIFFNNIFNFGSFNFKVIEYVKVTIKETVYRSSFIVSGPENLIKKNYSYIKSHFNLYSDNLKNRSELEGFKSKNLSNQILILENEKYKKLIDDYFIKDNEVYAKVLIDKQSPFLKSIVLNKGSKNNIELGMVVLDGVSLVGKVVEVNYITSRVLLLPDINSKIPVSLQPGDIQAIMSGDGSQNGILQYIKDKDLKNDQDEMLVLTSGAGGLFKSGIPIGKIKKQSWNNNEAKIDFDINFSQLKYVKIVSFKKQNSVLDKSSKEVLERSNNQIEEIKIQKETVRILLEQKKIAKEVRLKIEEENSLLKAKNIKLENELFNLKKELNNQKTSEEEMKFLELNLLYGRKCKKTFYNKLYKVGTTEYRECVLKKGKN